MDGKGKTRIQIDNSTGASKFLGFFLTKSNRIWFNNFDF